MPSLIRSSRGYGKNNSSQVTDVNAKNTSLLLTGDQTSKPWIADNSLLNADPIRLRKDSIVITLMALGTIWWCHPTIKPVF